MRAWCADAARLQAYLALRAQVMRLVRSFRRAWVSQQKYRFALRAQVARLVRTSPGAKFGITRAGCALGGLYGITCAGCALGAPAPVRLALVCSTVSAEVCAACHIYIYIILAKTCRFTATELGDPVV